MSRLTVASEVRSDLAGKRVIVAGVESRRSHAVVEALSNAGCDLVVHYSGDAGADSSSPSDARLRAFHGPLADRGAAERFARTAFAAYGGADLVVPIVDLRAPPLPRSADAETCERAVGARLAMPFYIARTSAQLMHRLGIAGSILFFADAPPGRTGAFAGLLAGGLDAMTRGMAREWAASGLRVNAVRSGAAPVSEADACGGDDSVATLLYLAAARSGWISGMALAAGSSRATG